MAATTKQKGLADYPADALLKDYEAAPLLGLGAQTLREWRTRGVGPRFYRLSERAIRYRIADLLDWLERQAVETTRL